MKVSVKSEKNSKCQNRDDIGRPETVWRKCPVEFLFPAFMFLETDRHRQTDRQTDRQEVKMEEKMELPRLF